LIRFLNLSLLSLRGCVLSSNVVVGSNVTISPFTRIGSCKHPDEEASEGEEEDDDEQEAKPEGAVEYDTATLGAEGIGYVWKYGTEGQTPSVFVILNPVDPTPLSLLPSVLQSGMSSVWKKPKTRTISTTPRPLTSCLSVPISPPLLISFSSFS
jgi:hypothetical protein